ncbi:MAG TPA: ATP-binding protein [Spirochaetota bacterium]|nr:ATP-binding protein [Spirochaetota bacterium]
MNGLARALIAGLAELLLGAGLLSGQSAPPQGERIRVGVYENAPKVFTDEQGRPAGIFVDIIRHVGQLEGWQVEFVPGSWAEGLDRLERGEIDLMTDLARTPEREKRFGLNRVPVLSSWFQVYARKGSGIQSILDLRGKRIAVLDKSVQQSAFEHLAGSFGITNAIVGVADYAGVFAMTAEGRVDAAIVNHFFGNLHARKYGLVDTSVVFYPSTLHFGAPLGRNQHILDAIDRHLSELKRDTRSVYYHSLARWTSEEVPVKVPAWLVVGGLAVAGGLLLASSVSIMFKRKLDERTSELRRTNAMMEEKIGERTRDLASALERARDADRIKSAFLATMSHELRTPLNSIIGFTGILLQGLAGPLNEEQQKQMGMVQSSSRHLLSLINDVLDISKIEAGQLTLVNGVFEVCPVLEKIIRMLKPMAEGKGLVLELEIGPGVDRLDGDQRRVEQILINLLNNALKFTEKGGVRLMVRTDARRICFCVRDSGIGMKPEGMIDLFSPFHQIDSGLARKHEGTGLGLSICKRLVEMMGGTIDVVSEFGKGSQFTVCLPLGGSGDA